MASDDGRVQGENARLRAAIAQHKESTQCCAECGDAQQAEAVTPDGLLWAVLLEAQSAQSEVTDGE